MTEAMWIELIRFLPTLVWLGFAVAALVVARRILTSEAHRMTRVETPFVSVELAREVIEQASHTREGHPEAVPATLPFPRMSHAAEAGGPAPRAAGADPHGTVPARPVAVPQGGPTRPSGPPDGEPDGEPEGGPAERQAPEDETEEQVVGETPQPVIPPQRFPTRSEPYPSTTEPSLELPPTDQVGRPSYPAPRQNLSADSQRGLRAATRLALSTDLLKGGSILWVDDHHEWNEPLARLFRTAGINVDTVSSTDEAMRAMANAPYDLVVSDMRRDADPGGESAGMVMLDRMVVAGIPTPAVFFSGAAEATASLHPRAVTATSSPETLVNHVVDIVGERRHRYGDGRQSRFLWRNR